ncbi:MAG: acyltransferase [Alphaproteobacteria bacterium]
MIHQSATVSPLASVARDAHIGPGAIIHPFVTILPGVLIEEACQIFPGAVLGRPPVATAAIARRPDPVGGLRLATGIVVGAGAVIYAGVEIDAESLVGDHAVIRERVDIGARCIVGQGVTVGYEVEIADEVRIMDNAHITGRSRIGRGTFIAQHVTTANDSALAQRLAADAYEFRSDEVRGVDIGAAVFIGAGACILPGIRIGDRAIIGAQALVTHDVEDGVTVMGIPARPPGAVALDPASADGIRAQLAPGERTPARKPRAA